MTKKTYIVSWEVELTAAGPISAALAAQEIQRDPKNSATVFEVSSEDGVTKVDTSTLPKGRFRDSACWKCKDGANPCVEKDPTRCSYPHPRND